MLKFSRNAFQKNKPLAWSRKGSKYTLRNWLRSEANRETRISIRHVGIYVQFQSSIDRTAVPFSPRQSTTKVALVKATKHKLNPATDEVRVEKRNHGLAWSNENERTFQSIIYPVERKNFIGISNILAWGKSRVGLPPPFIASNDVHTLSKPTKSSPLLANYMTISFNISWALFPVPSAILLPARARRQSRSKNVGIW